MIILVRHAATDSAKGRCIGRTPVPLSSKGLEQAEHLAEVLEDAPLVRLVCSPAARARETVAPLAQRLGLPVEDIPALNEIDMGAWDGLDFTEIRSRYPREYASRGEGFGDFIPPGGESFNQVADRALEVMATLSGGPLPVLVMTHAGVIRSVSCRLTGHPMDDLFHFTPGHARCSVLDIQGRELRLRYSSIGPEDIPEMLQGSV
ncbi:histidine phosphatase family protein [Pseudodesulfovibrio cashew]|uniref:Histidine phosphatase family protein n=1 Tax=Pseudodesulfovibrio cashew TaxID=2678688 RepID=A0A6I6JK12_9BACT|nr:histidine phosphatase family protein [Pseudodesulfovibrio cashew]QGY41489.1 histidine phosphatase family protein [Pseudodesulfovibrio cashew]